MLDALLKPQAVQHSRVPEIPTLTAVYPNNTYIPRASVIKTVQVIETINMEKMKNRLAKLLIAHEVNTKENLGTNKETSLLIVLTGSQVLMCSWPHAQLCTRWMDTSKEDLGRAGGERSIVLDVRSQHHFCCTNNT